VIRIKAQDDVVENVDFEKLACSDEVTGDFDVGLGWCRFTAYAACGISGEAQPSDADVKVMGNPSHASLRGLGYFL